MIQKWYRLYASSLLAGICISIGCIVNLKTGGVVGPIMFAFGLITVVHYKFKLFTGTAGFIHGKQEAYQLVHILIGNIMCKKLICVENCRIENDKEVFIKNLSWTMNDGEVWLVIGPERRPP